MQKVQTTRLAWTAALLFPVLATASIAAPVKTVRFSEEMAEVARLAKPSVAVSGDAGTAMFMAGETYIRTRAGNSSGRVHLWNTTRGLVRISPDGSPAVWLRCRDLEPMTIACSTAFGIEPTGVLVISKLKPQPAQARDRGQIPTGTGESALPSCPGDPRCPKL